MKKLFIAAAILVAFASCSKDQITDVAPSQQLAEIGFTNLNDRVTKAANANGDNYKVYSVQTGNSTLYIAGDERIGSTEATDDALENSSKAKKHYYWPTDESTLSFYAYAPASADVTVNTTTDAIGFEYTIPTGAQEDLTLATPIPSQTADVVPLKFKHVLSKVTVNVLLSDGLTDAGYTVKKDANNVVTYTTDLIVNKTKGTADVFAGTFAADPSDNTTATYSAKNSYIIIPQASTGCSIQIKELTLLNDSDSEVFTKNLAPYVFAAGNITGDAFDANKHYTINITIDGTSSDDKGDDLIGEITFSTEIVEGSDWGAVTAGITAADK